MIAEMLYIWLASSNICEEKTGNVLASYRMNPWWAMEVTTYITRKKPTETLTMAKKGVISGLQGDESMTTQSREKAPRPSPLMPEPNCWASVEFGKIQLTQGKIDKVGKMQPGSQDCVPAEAAYKCNQENFPLWHTIVISLMKSPVRRSTMSYLLTRKWTRLGEGNSWREEPELDYKVTTCPPGQQRTSLILPPNHNPKSIPTHWLQDY